MQNSQEDRYRPSQNGTKWQQGQDSSSQLKRTQSSNTSDSQPASKRRKYDRFLSDANEVKTELVDDGTDYLNSSETSSSPTDVRGARYLDLKEDSEGTVGGQINQDHLPHFNGFSGELDLFGSQYAASNGLCNTDDKNGLLEQHTSHNHPDSGNAQSLQKPADETDSSPPNPNSHSSNTQSSPETKQAKQTTRKRSLGSSKSSEEGPDLDPKDEEKKEKNRKYAKQSRERKNNKLYDLEQENQDLEATIQIYKKIISMYYIDHNHVPPSWKTEKMEWHLEHSAKGGSARSITCLLPQQDKAFCRRLGNSQYGTIIDGQSSKTSEETLDSLEMSKMHTTVMEGHEVNGNNNVQGIAPDGGQAVKQEQQSMQQVREKNSDRVESGGPCAANTGHGQACVGLFPNPQQSVNNAAISTMGYQSQNNGLCQISHVENASSNSIVQKTQSSLSFETPANRAGNASYPSKTPVVHRSHEVRYVSQQPPITKYISVKDGDSNENFNGKPILREALPEQILTLIRQSDGTLKVCNLPPSKNSPALVRYMPARSTHNTVMSNSLAANNRPAPMAAPPVASHTSLSPDSDTEDYLDIGNINCSL